MIKTFGQGGLVVTNDALPEPRPDGSTGTDDIHRFRITTLQHALYLETKGIRATRGRSVSARVKSEFGLRGRVRRVYEEFSAMHNLPLIEERRRG